MNSASAAGGVGHVLQDITAQETHVYDAQAIKSAPMASHVIHVRTDMGQADSTADSTTAVNNASLMNSAPMASHVRHVRTAQSQWSHKHSVFHALRMNSAPMARYVRYVRTAQSRTPT